MRKDNIFTPIQDRIKQVEERMRAQADGHHPELNIALEYLLSSGGKRVRPAVALLIGGMLGGDPQRLVTLGGAIDLLHTATLVHDDLIDGALFRRGIATLNARWSPAATVLAGDFIFARAAKLAAETESGRVIKLFAETLATIVNGEITQMFTSRGTINRDDYYRRIYAKTASMFELASTAAAYLSPVDDQAVAAARNYGYEIGMAFQIVDDVLDFTAEPGIVGKPVARDLRQGVLTLPVLCYLEKNSDDSRMYDWMNSRILDADHLDGLIDSIRASGAIQEAMEEAERYMECALAALRGQPESVERQALEELSRYVVHREL